MTVTRPRKKTVTLEIIGSPWARLALSGAEALKNDGRLRVVVLAMIRAGHDPSPADLAGALRERPPDPATIARVPLTQEEQTRLQSLLLDDPPADFVRAWWREHISDARRLDAVARAREVIETDTATLCAYVARVYVLGRPRKPGVKQPPRTLTYEARIAKDYFVALAKATAAHEADSRKPRDAATVKRQIATRYRIGKRTVERIIKGLRANIS